LPKLRPARHVLEHLQQRGKPDKNPKRTQKTADEQSEKGRAILMVWQIDYEDNEQRAADGGDTPKGEQRDLEEPACKRTGGREPNYAKQNGAANDKSTNLQRKAVNGVHSEA